METRELILEIREAELLSRAGADELADFYDRLTPAQLVAKLFTQLKAVKHEASLFKQLHARRCEELEALKTGVDPMDPFGDD